MKNVDLSIWYQYSECYALDALVDSQVLQRLSEFPQHAADIKYLNPTFDV